ncbi:MAG: bifunctional methylenetetrahydrofolate dehydrogenase/methenyltetrahydrofolate cyclohydrolase FolD [Ruminococcaceae bacterium]|nr:bifunctional methylenetetrahydrofolate dehydrogenase/methenyltetrahydrofolate cyclohydrolase FolD [Oscillospiraceae bacterium]
MAIIMDGKALAKKVKMQQKEQAEILKAKGVEPCLAVVIVGENPASKVYVAGKIRDCEEVGITSREYALPASTTQDELLALVSELNNDDSVSGFIVQLPLPSHIDEKTILDAIDPKKDVDAFHPINVGKIMIGDYDFLPCTPAGVMELLEEYKIDISGKECVVVGRSNIVGKPQAMLLLHKNGTVTVCHSRTKNLSDVTRRADILVVAIGKGEFVTGDMIKEGAVVIDVGMNRNDEGKLVGDVHFESAKEKASYITPVPGGVGVMTRAILMKNAIKAAQLNQDK